MPEGREISKPRPPGPEPKHPPGPDQKPNPLCEAGDHFSKLSRRLIDAVNTPGGLEPGGHNADLRPVLRAAADIFAAGASAFSGITRMGIDGGHLTEEDLELIAEIETWAAHMRNVTLVIQRALGDPPAEVAPRTRRTRPERKRDRHG